MKKDMIFFSADGQGLTSTSANHVANLAKEMVRVLETTLASMVLYSTSVALIGSDTENKLNMGAAADDLTDMPRKLRTRAKAKSLIAWLREAIKAKERLAAEAANYTLEDYCRDRDIEMPKMPEAKPYLTEDDYYASLPIGERNRYYELETVAAVLGQAIHPGGSFATARDALATRLKTPREVSGDGRDTLIYTYTPTVDPEAVEEVYFKIQKQYREAQAALNAIKFECERAVKESELAARNENLNATKAYNERVAMLRDELSKYNLERVKAVGDMRIVIPESLREIYNEVTSLGKK